MSELALKLIAQEKEEKNGSLDLGNCGLTKLPEELFELEHLESLIVSNEYYDWEKDEWVETLNKGPRNYIRSIPDQITNLINIKVLIIGGGRDQWGIKDISCLEKLIQLQTLDLRSNQISDVHLLEELTNLQILYLNNNQIQDYSFLENLTNLQYIDQRIIQKKEIPDQTEVRLTNLENAPIEREKRVLKIISNLSKYGLNDSNTSKKVAAWKALIAYLMRRQTLELV